MAKRQMKGIVGIFKDEESLKTAAKKIRDAKVYDFDAFTPFPVHGLEDAMNIPRSKIPWVTFFGGLFGCSAGLGLQWWASAVNWRLNVGGKPFFSLPAFIPITFEITVLIAGLSTAAALFVFCGLPNFNAQVLHPDITNDKFALFVSSTDPNYKESDFMTMMKNSGAVDVRVV